MNHIRNKYKKICQHLQMYEDSSEMIGQRPLFRQKTRCHIARVIICYCRLSTSIHHRMALSTMPGKICCVITKYIGRFEKRRVANWKGIIMGRHGPRGFCGKKELNRQILKTVYV